MPARGQDASCFPNSSNVAHPNLTFTAKFKVPPDIWYLIFGPPNIVVDNPDDLLCAQWLCWEVNSLIQRYIYRHVNLHNFKAFSSFHRAVTQNPLRPGQWVRTLQISFNTQHLPKRFFNEMSEVLLALDHLYCLNFCYSHHDSAFASKLRKLAPSMMPSLKEIHLKPIFLETELDVPGVRIFQCFI
jgi:hypothetical protein